MAKSLTPTEYTRAWVDVYDFEAIIAVQPFTPPRPVLVASYQLPTPSNSVRHCYGSAHLGPVPRVTMQQPGSRRASLTTARSTWESRGFPPRSQDMVGEDRLFVVQLALWQEYAAKETCFIFTHASTLLAHSYQPGALPITVPWDEWGSTHAKVMREIGEDSNMIYSCHGYRFVFSAPSPGPEASEIVVLDFNPANVVRFLHRESAWPPPPSSPFPLSRVQARAEEDVDLVSFKGSVKTRLPYLMSTLSDRFDNFNGVIIDDERISVVQVSHLVPLL